MKFSPSKAVAEAIANMGRESFTLADLCTLAGNLIPPEHAYRRHMRDDQDDGDQETYVAKGRRDMVLEAVRSFLAYGSLSGDLHGEMRTTDKLWERYAPSMWGAIKSPELKEAAEGMFAEYGLEAGYVKQGLARAIYLLIKLDREREVVGAIPLTEAYKLVRVPPEAKSKIGLHIVRMSDGKIVGRYFESSCKSAELHLQEWNEGKRHEYSASSPPSKKFE